MWAKSPDGEIRHMWGGDGNPVSLCGSQGRLPLDYLQVHLPKCAECLRLLGKRREFEYGTCGW